MRPIKRGQKADTEMLLVLKSRGIRAKVVEGKLLFEARNISPIHTMHERAILNTAQYSAGKKLRECWVSGWIGHNNFEIKERVDGCGNEKEITTNQIHSQKEFERAKKAAKRDWALVNQVVINEIPLTQKGMGGQERARLIYAFRRALDDIARCYGFI